MQKLILLVVILSITTINCQNVYISGYVPTITAYNAQGSTLTPLSTSNGPAAPSFMAFHPTKAVVYAINENGGTVSAYRIASSGSLALMNTISSGGTTPAHVSVHPSGNLLYTTNYGSGEISVATILSDGSIGAQIFNEVAGANTHMAITDPSGSYLFVVCKGSNYIVQYKTNADGTLTRNNPPLVNFPGGSGPRHIAFHPTRNFVYLLTELSNQVITLTYTPSTGTLYGAQALSSLPPSFSGGSTGAEIQTHPNGQFVYASNRGHNSIGIWSVKSDGTLASVGWENGGGAVNVPRHFSINPTGTIMYVANMGSGSVTIFNIAANTGTLTKVNSMDVTSQPSFVQTAPSYVASTSTTTSSTTSSSTVTSNSPASSSTPRSSSSAPSASTQTSGATPCDNKDTVCNTFCGSLVPSKCECDPTTGTVHTIVCEASSGSPLLFSFAILASLTTLLMAV